MNEFQRKNRSMDVNAHYRLDSDDDMASSLESIEDYTYKPTPHQIEGQDKGENDRFVHRRIEALNGMDELWTL